MIAPIKDMMAFAPHSISRELWAEVTSFAPACNLKTRSNGLELSTDDVYAIM